MVGKIDCGELSSIIHINTFYPLPQLFHDLHLLLPFLLKAKVYLPSQPLTNNQNIHNILQLRRKPLQFQHFF